MRTFRAFAILQLADLATTLIALRLGAFEQNPLLLAGFMTTYGATAGIVLSKALLLALGLGLSRRGYLVTNVVFSGIVTWNLSVIARLCFG